MGTSTNGQLCYGIVLDEYFQFPWESEEEETWWAETNGFEKYEDCSDENTYWTRKRDFLQKNPCPVKLVNYCSGECPMYILACPGTFTRAYRGSPFRINPKLLDETQYLEQFNAFVEKFFPELVNSPRGWFLSSYWG